MKLLVFCTLAFGLAAYSDAAVTFTTPATGGAAPACSGMSVLNEGATTGTIETVVAASDGTGLTLSLAAATDNIFDLDGASNAITIGAPNLLDFETSATINLIIVGNDDAGTASTATCTVSLVNLAPEASGVRSKEIIVPASTATNDAILTVTCSDGAGTISSFAAVAGNSDKFDFNTGTGAVTKSSTAFATSDTYWTLKYTCNDGVSTATVTYIVCYDSETNCPNTAASKTGILAMLLPPAVYMVYQLF